MPRHLRAEAADCVIGGEDGLLAKLANGETMLIIDYELQMKQIVTMKLPASN